VQGCTAVHVPTLDGAISYKPVSFLLTKLNFWVLYDRPKHRPTKLKNKESCLFLWQTKVQKHRPKHRPEFFISISQLIAIIHFIMTFHIVKWAKRSANFI